MISNDPNTDIRAGSKFFVYINNINIMQNQCSGKHSAYQTNGMNKLKS